MKNQQNQQHSPSPLAQTESHRQHSQLKSDFSINTNKMNIVTPRPSQIKINLISLLSSQQLSLQSYRKNSKAPSLATSTRLNESLILGQLQFLKSKEKVFRRKIILVDAQLIDTYSNFIYYDFPYYEKPNMQQNRRFQEVIEDIQKLLKKNHPVHLFTKDGVEVTDFYSLPEKQHLVFVSIKPFFNGLDNFKNEKPIYTVLIEQEQQIIKFYENYHQQFRLCEKTTQPSSNMSSPRRLSTSHQRLQSLYNTLKDCEQIHRVIKKSKFSNEFPYFPINFRIKPKTSEMKKSRKLGIQFSTEELNYIENIDKMIEFDIKQYIESKLSENPFVPSKKLDKIINFYDKLLKQPLRFQKPPKNLQEFPGTSDPNENVKKIDDERISLQLQNILEKEFNLTNQKPEVNFPQSSKMISHLIQKWDKPLFISNIPKLKEQSNFSRYQLHSIYLLYKVLHLVTAQKNRKLTPFQLGSGIDFQTFRNGLYQIFLQSEQLARGLFQIVNKRFTGFLNWEEFLNLMSSMQGSTIESKIDVFIQVADQDGNGQLSYEEVKNLCKITLERVVVAGDGNFLDKLSDFYTKIVFDSVMVDYEKEIPLELIKHEILQKNENSNLLLMFCGADI